MTTIDPAALAQIQQKLATIESEHNVCILYACELGSRAWGFEAPDSDFDVRFVYAHPQDWYLSVDVNQKRDVIELPISDDWDFSGWDIRKTLQLFQKSNTPLHEWLASPIVYSEQSAFVEPLRQLARESYNPNAAHSHYVRRASKHYHSYLKDQSVRRKKYLYAVMPLLAAQWLELDRGIVPMSFEVLVSELVSDEILLQEIAELVQQKKAGAEIGEGAPLPAIQSFVEAELERHQTTDLKRDFTRVDVERLNVLFRDTLASSDAG